MEQSVHAVLRNREMAISQYEELGIPVDWLLDSGVVGKVCEGKIFYDNASKGISFMCL